MAERYAVATGNWSALATWDGGASLPGVGDTVHANGYTVTIDQDITVGSVRTDAGATAVAGGGFTLNDHTVNADIVAGTTQCLSYEGTGTAVINGDVTGGASLTAYGCRNNQTGTLTISGDVAGGSASSTIGCYTRITGTTTINGNVTAGSGNSAHGLYNNGTGTVTINGNVTGGSGSAAYGVYNNNSGGTITITGDVTAGTQARGAYNHSTGNILISGNITAVGSVAAVHNNSTGIISFGGNAIASSTGYHPFATGRWLIDDGNDQQLKLREDAGSGVAGAETTFYALEKWAVQTGDWSDGATWSGGTVPEDYHHCYANSYTVAVDQSDTADTVRTEAGPEIAAAGGGFTLSDGVTLTADVIAGTTSCVAYSGSTSAALVGNVTGGDTSSARGVDMSGAGALTITGNVIAGSAGAHGIQFSGAGTLNVIGSVTGSATAAGEGIRTISGSTGTLVINGNVTGGDGSAGHGLNLNDSGLTQIIGNVLGGSTNSYGINISTVSAGQLEITGNVTGGSHTAGYGIYARGACSTEITGNVLATAARGLALIDPTVSCTVIGNVTASAATNNTMGIYAGSGYLEVTGNIYGGGATSAYGIFVANTATVVVTGDVFGGTAGAGNAHGIYFNSTDTLTVVGDVTAGDSTSRGIQNVNTGTVSVTGTITGGSTATGTSGIDNNSTGTVNVVGDVYSNVGYGIENDGGGTTNVTGTIYGSNTLNTRFGVFISSGTLNVDGDIQAGSAGAPIGNTGGLVYLQGNMIGHANGYSFGSGRLLIDPDNAQILQMRENNAGSPGDARSLYTLNAYPGV